ncbi:MAG TPA: M57 family metalloprotease [Chitinophaga sp.]|uniref:M57 family metalloprotease n=1 Tax=Chitinophaga sp. TaxID=1869181 RepID=UPI002C174CB7|nr:M57 family metalloprotease [Chitinophaga sp.]HVI43640.1 M57 family metalloprotease [Chitinophaga sp.]
MLTTVFSPRLSLILLFLTLPVLLLSCRKEQHSSPEIFISQTDEIAILRKFIAESVHDTQENIQFDRQNNTFLIGGDVIMPLADARQHYKQNRERGVRTEQRRSTYTMSSAVIANIGIYVARPGPVPWLQAVTQAIANWNAAGCGIHVSLVTDPKIAQILIYMQYDPAPTPLATASYPTSAGNPGPTLIINTRYPLSSSEMQLVLTHELGHCFGFTHTNESFGLLIPGTPVSDRYSVMNSTVVPWNGFSHYDLLAFKTVYP